MKKTLALLFCLLFPAVAWAASAQDCETMINNLSKAISDCEALEKRSSDYDIVLRRDPMEPFVDDEGNVLSRAGFHAGLVVQGIVRSGKMKKILVDNVFYSEGNMVGPYKILEIKKNGFWALEDGERIFVPLYAEDSKPKSS